MSGFNPQSVWEWMQGTEEERLEFIDEILPLGLQRVADGCELYVHYFGNGSALQIVVGPAPVCDDGYEGQDAEDAQEALRRKINRNTLEFARNSVVGNRWESRFDPTILEAWKRYYGNQLMLESELRELFFGEEYDKSIDYKHRVLERIELQYPFRADW